MYAVPSPRVAVRYLGDFSAHVGGAPVERWRAGKARHLFQYLVLNRGKVLSRDKLQEMLWPDSDWSPRSSSVKVAMHALRRILRDNDGTGRPPAVEIVFQDNGYLLRARDIWVDVEEFAAQCRQGRTAQIRGDHQLAVAAYSRAVELYTGDFLAADTQDWVLHEREWNRSLVLQALKYLQEDALCREDFPAAITLSRRMLDIDPYQEQVYGTLMRVHAELGELGRVKSWYDLCARRMREDLNVLPSEETRRVLSRALERSRGSHRPVLVAA